MFQLHAVAYLSRTFQIQVLLGQLYVRIMSFHRWFPRDNRRERSHS